MRHVLIILSAFILLSQGGCAARPPATAYPRIPSYAIVPSTDIRLGKALAPELRLHPGESGFRLLTHGTGAFLMRIAAVRAAQKSVDLQYFSTRDDTTGKLLLAALLDAADHGVRVRLLLDDWNLDDFRQGAAALHRHKNIYIRVFNPFATRDQSVFSKLGSLFTTFDRRMHNKAMMVDNQIAIMGGRNLGDEYFDAARDINFRDVDVLAAGPVVQAISSNFDRYWNSVEAYPLGALSLPPTDEESVEELRRELACNWQHVMHLPDGKRLRATAHLAEDITRHKISFFWGPAELGADSPLKVDMPLDETVSRPEEKISELVKHAQHEFVIISPYFVPGEDGVKWLVKLARRGVKVRILTNSLASTDMVPADAGYSHYREQLVAAGVELYELKPVYPEPQFRRMFKISSAQHGLHAKVYMMDRRAVVIGSFNMDPRSIRLNTEQVLVIESAPLAEEVARLFDHITSPEFSYHVIAADKMDTQVSCTAPPISSIIWVTQENGKKVCYDFSPKAGFWRRILTGFFSLLPLDGEL